MPIFFLLLCAPLWAQPRLEGTLTQTHFGVSQTARIASEAPDKLRVETAREILVANGEQTLIYSKPTRRLRVFSVNLARRWTRGHGLLSGGPANFALFGMPEAPVLDAQNGILWRDQTFFGGALKTAFYATFKSRRDLYPARVEVSPTLRVEKNRAGSELFRATLTLVDGVPKDAQSGEIFWRYDLKKRDVAFDDGVFSPSFDALPEAGDADVVAGEFDRALRLWSGGIDAGAAMKSLAALPQTTTAPALARFEIALSINDFAVAQTALQVLESLQLERAELETRRARFLESTRDFAGARIAWQKATEAAPRDYELTRSRANFLRSLGDLEGARTLWKAILDAQDAPRQTQIDAVNEIVLWSAPDEWKTLRDAIPANATSEAWRLARALYSLRLGEETSENFESQSAQSAFALGLERAGKRERALALWQNLAGSLDTQMKRDARVRLMLLAASKNDFAAATTIFDALQSALSSEAEASELRRVFFHGWQKSFARSGFEKWLDGRASATRSTLQDARLWADYSDFYGQTEALSRILEVNPQLKNSAFGNSKNAERWVNEALSLSLTDPVQRARRAFLWTQIVTALDAAIAAQPDQPFYRMQKTLALAQRAANIGASDAASAVSERAVAREAVQDLIKSVPNDPDALVCAAIALLSFDGERGARQAIAWCERALNSPPFDGERRALVFAARQTMVGALEIAGDARAAISQSEILVMAARGAEESAQLLAQQFGIYERAGATENAAALAAIVARAAQTRWDFEGGRSVLDALSQRALTSPARTDILAALREGTSPASKIAWANASIWRLRAAQAALAMPGAPASADAELERAQRELRGASMALAQIANGEDRILAAKAAVFLAERAGNSPEEGQKFLRLALQNEPRALGIQLAFLQNLPEEQRTEQSRKIVASAGALGEVVGNWEGTRQIALSLWQQRNDNAARALTRELFQSTQISPVANAVDFQRAAFAFAKMSFAQDEALAASIYTGLSDASWAPLDRAAALLAWRQKYLDAEKPAGAARFNERIATLELTPEQIELAADYVQEVEN